MPVDTSTLRGSPIQENFDVNVAGGADVTLGDAARYRTLTFTGAITADISVIFPLGTLNAGRFYNVANLSTGAFQIGIKGPGGTALVIPQGMRAEVKWTGSVFVFGDTQILRAEVALTSAQVKALRATPITLVPAPGVGMVSEFLSAVLVLIYGGTNAFTEATANLQVKYTDGSGAGVSEVIESTGFIDQTASTMTLAAPKVGLSGGIAVAPIVAKAGADNQPLVLHNVGAGEIAGNAAADNLLKVFVSYRAHSPRW